MLIAIVHIFFIILTQYIGSLLIAIFAPKKYIRPLSLAFLCFYILTVISWTFTEGECAWTVLEKKTQNEDYISGTDNRSPSFELIGNLFSMSLAEVRHMHWFIVRAAMTVAATNIFFEFKYRWNALYLFLFVMSIQLTTDYPQCVPHLGQCGRAV